MTHRIPDNDGGRGAVAAKVQANFHAGVSTADYENFVF